MAQPNLDRPCLPDEGPHQRQPRLQACRDGMAEMVICIPSSRSHGQVRQQRALRRRRRPPRHQGFRRHACAASSPRPPKPPTRCCCAATSPTTAPPRKPRCWPTSWAPSRCPSSPCWATTTTNPARRRGVRNPHATPACACSTARPARSQGVGIAGVKGFAGGFGRGSLGAWGEPAIKLFVQEALHEAMKLESALAKLRTPRRIALLHYSPIAGTVEGEPLEIFAFLGSQPAGGAAAALPGGRRLPRPRAPRRAGGQDHQRRAGLQRGQAAAAARAGPSGRLPAVRAAARPARRAEAAVSVRLERRARDRPHALVGARRAQHQRVAEHRSDELQADRQAAAASGRTGSCTPAAASG